MFNSLTSLKTRPKIFLGISVPLIMLLVLGSISVFALGSIIETGRWVVHTDKMIGQSNAITVSAVDMETGMRGYLLAGKEEFLESYEIGKDTTFALITDLQQTVRDNPSQVKQLVNAARILRNWLREVDLPPRLVPLASLDHSRCSASGDCR